MIDESISFVLTTTFVARVLISIVPLYHSVRSVFLQEAGLCLENPYTMRMLSFIFFELFVRVRK